MSENRIDFQSGFPAPHPNKLILSIESNIRIYLVRAHG